MKIKLFVALVAIISFSLKSYGQFTFGVSPGIGLNSTYFGYKLNDKLVPFIGFQYAHVKFKYEETGEEFDYDLGDVVSYSYKTEFSGSLYVPNIGIKYFIKQQNKLNAYVSLCISKPFLSGKLEYDGEADEEFKNQIKNISLWGGEAGFGVEYFFDDNFSIGGEFGLRYLHLKYNDSYDYEFYNPNTGDYEMTEIKDDYRLNVSPTFSKLSLNFYF
jgi:hypothetical protein